LPDERDGLGAEGLVAGQTGDDLLEPAQGRGRAHDKGSQEDERLPPAGGWEPSRAGREAAPVAAGYSWAILYARSGARSTGYPAFRRGLGPGRPAGTATVNVMSGR